MTPRNVLRRLVPADEKPKLENLLTVSFVGDGERRIHLFDRTKPPREIIRLYDLTGAYLNAAVGEQADQAGDSSPSEEDAANVLFRSERARIDGTEPPITWPEKVRRVGSAWIVDVDTSRLPSDYPQQFVLEVAGTEAAADNASLDTLYAKLQQVVEADTHEERKQAKAALATALRKRYAGKISGQTEIGSKEATEHSARMSELMRLWNPIGFAVRDVKSILGPPTREWERGENDSFTHYAGFQYDFDFGYDGAHWQFTVEGDSVEPDSTISGIRYIPGE